MNSAKSLLFDWFRPEGVIALGVLVGLVQQFLASHRTNKAVKLLADTKAVSMGNSEKIDKVNTILGVVIEQTNGMSEKLQRIAGEAGEQRGRDSAAAEQANRDKSR